MLNLITDIYDILYYKSNYFIFQYISYFMIYNKSIS